MTSIVVAGRADDPRFAQAEYLARYVEASMPHFKVEVRMHHPEDWPDELQHACLMQGFAHRESPLIWEGAGRYIGGLNEFMQHIKAYYDIALEQDRALLNDVAQENYGIAERQKQIKAAREYLAKRQQEMDGVANRLMELQNIADQSQRDVVAVRDIIDHFREFVTDIKSRRWKDVGDQMDPSQHIEGCQPCPDPEPEYEPLSDPTMTDPSTASTKKTASGSEGQEGDAPAEAAPEAAEGEGAPEQEASEAQPPPPKERKELPPRPVEMEPFKMAITTLLAEMPEVHHAGGEEPVLNILADFQVHTEKLTAKLAEVRGGVLKDITNLVISLMRDINTLQKVTVSVMDSKQAVLMDCVKDYENLMNFIDESVPEVILQTAKKITEAEATGRPISVQ
eukprot:GFYU01010275.1.p1 GENE.GFYU01010275.1~~GFYU01010275.1.p1  ORF type:complete len:395 (+),score=111.48 GFYU01010275.1:261-1445(+)